MNPTAAQDTLTLDPADWNDMRRLSHQMVDDMLDFLQTIHEQPVWTQPTTAVKDHFNQPLPRQGQDMQTVYGEFLQYILPFHKGNIHPRFFGWVQTTGNPLGMMADMLASGMTPNTSVGDHAAVYVDGQVVNWCKALMNWPADSSGILVSGASMANLTALLVARQAADQQMRQKGVRATAGELVLYTSAEAHSCVQKAVEVMGLGREALRKVPVDGDYQMDVGHLKTMIADDLARGYQPFCVVGNVGTVNTGSTDPLDAIADLCQAYGLWFHVDGAFGALAKLVPEFQAELRAIERADSLAFDLHKWLSLPYEIGCALIKDKTLHRATFSMTPNYLTTHERGLAAGPDPINQYGIELSRGFKALKAWMCFKTFGIDKMARVIQQNIEQTRYLAEQIVQEPRLELLAPVPLNIVCYRFNPGGMNTERLNQLNREILMQLHEQGIAAPSYTMLNGQYAIRVCNVNHRTTLPDLDALVAGTIRIGESLL